MYGKGEETPRRAGAAGASRADPARGGGLRRPGPGRDRATDRPEPDPRECLQDPAQAGGEGDGAGPPGRADSRAGRTAEDLLLGATPGRPGPAIQPGRNPADDAGNRSSLGGAMTSRAFRGPPRRGLWLLQRLLPGSVRESFIGDLTEAFRQDLASGLPLRTARWRFWQETAAAILSLSTHRPPAPPMEKDLMGTLLSDIRYGFRHLSRTPGFTALAVLVMALGIGATTAIFSVANPVLFRSLPYPGSDRLLMVWERASDGAESNTTFPTYSDIKARAHTLATAAVMSYWRPTLTGGDEPERLLGQRVSWSYFSLLGVA